MRIQIISKDNGVGLSHDYRVLRTAILLAMPEAEVVFVDWQRPQDGKRSDINFFLELLSGPFLQQAPRNIYVPNPEWYYSHLWGSLLPRLTEIWAKTKDCQRIFERLHGRVVHSGWTSEDIMDDTVERSIDMIHVAGASSAKGTAQVLEVAKQMPSQPFILVSREPRAVPDNVTLLLSPSDERLRFEQNRCLIHLCPSSYEGFGHYINEARACGAFVITTNAEPMNELIGQKTGAGVGAMWSTTQQLATLHHVDVPSLLQTAQAVSSIPPARLAVVGKRAREAYLFDRWHFHQFVAQSLAA